MLQLNYSLEKISNFNAITTSMQQITYDILFDRYFDLSNLFLNELVVKLENKENRSNIFIYARFIMIIINHFVKEIEINRKEDTIYCWVRNERVFKYHERINLHPLYHSSIHHSYMYTSLLIIYLIYFNPLYLLLQQSVLLLNSLSHCW